MRRLETQASLLATAGNAQKKLLADFISALSLGVQRELVK